MTWLRSLWGWGESFDASVELWPDAVRPEARRVQTGDGWAATLILVGWPGMVSYAWLEPLVDQATRLEVALHLDGVPAEVAAARLRKQRARMESTQRYVAAKEHLDDPRLDAAASDAAGLASRIARGDTRLHAMSFYVTVHAPTPETLDRSCARLRATAAAMMCDLRPATFRPLQGLTSTVPVGIDSLGARRTVDTDTAAAAFPFGSPDVPGPPGEQAVLYGLNAISGAPVLWDRWAEDNYNSIVVARSGAGKSYFAKTTMLRELYQDTSVTVIDPEGEYRALADAVGGTVCAPGAAGEAINPLALPTQASPEDLTRRKLFCATVIETALGENLSSTEAAAVDAAVAAAYAACGITDEPGTWGRKPPIMPEVTALLAEGSEIGASLAARLAPYVTGGLSSLLAGHTETASTAGPGQLHVFDLSAVPEEMAAVTTLVVLDAIWRSLRTDGVRRLVAVDEAWLLLRDGAGAAFLSRLAKSARKRNAGLMVITQDADDLLSTSLGHTVIANSATQVLLRQAPQSIAAVTAAFALTDTEADLIASARRGDALLLAGQTRVAFSTIAAPEEHRLCLTGLEAFGDGGR
ncbi:DUF87 domain-containing protein [Glycomyces buryatensis]|uniref:DUF87 domain-containing protein n=2 Tax=Glycomyces buryatensis TaxID=2570927 RepID=A0A4S8PW27_9ACTN|nr:DUF87 domain-containing protein [Glycomyces buryatensis]